MPPRLVHPAARLSRLPSELFLALPRRRAFTSSLALAARQQQQQQGQSSTAPSQAVPRLTLDLSGNALHRRHQGPFAMGTGMDSVVRQGSDRPWSELSVGSKVARLSQKTTSLLVVSFGGLLFFVIFTTVSAELFSPNSSTAIFGRAVGMLEESDELKLYLIPPYTFHPPHSPQPLRQASNTRSMALHTLPSRTSFNKEGVESQTFVFVVEGQEEGGYRTATGWLGKGRETVGSWVGGVGEWARAELEQAGLLEKRAELEAEEKAKEEEVGVGSWLGGLVGLRRDARPTPKKRKASVPELGTFTTGECLVRCEKDPQTHRLLIKHLSVSIPSSSSTSTFSRPYRFSVPVPAKEGEGGFWGKVGGWWAEMSGGGDKGEEEKGEGPSSSS